MFSNRKTVNRINRLNATQKSNTRSQTPISLRAKQIEQSSHSVSKTSNIN